MESDAPVIYGLEFQARALTAHTAETELCQFFVGTQSLRCDNQVHCIDFDDENNVINKTQYLHSSGEIWSINASAIQRNVFSTVYNHVDDGKAEMCAAVWRLPKSAGSDHPGDDSLSNAPPLELQTTVNTASYGSVKSVLWHPTGESSTFLVLADSHLVVYDLEPSSSSAKEVSSTVLEGKTQPRFTCGKWNSHHNCVQIATASDTSIRGWDIRTLQQTYCIENAHGQFVRDLDFNPNKQYYLSSCGDDCKTKFWDIRNPSTPLKVLTDHSHWVWNVRYNHFHDQLVLTGSSDSRVLLTNLTSISSEPYGRLIDDQLSDNEGDNDLPAHGNSNNGGPMPDGIVHVYEDHEESVYGLEWSCSDPWIFASLSYDGRLVINRVPRATKYRIIL